jgi:hypothetical protein
VVKFASDVMLTASSRRDSSVSAESRTGRHRDAALGRRCLTPAPFSTCREELQARLAPRYFAVEPSGDARRPHEWVRISRSEQGLATAC